MARMLRVAVLAIAIAAVFGGLIGGTREAAAGNGYEQWVLGDDGQCGYYWDGYSYTLSGCIRADGGYDFYLASYGQWVYTFSAGTMSDGTTWLYYQGLYYYDSVDNGMYPTSATIGAPSWSGMTGNILIDQIMLDSNNAIIDTILAPNCIEVVGDTCYY